MTWLQRSVVWFFQAVGTLFLLICAFLAVIFVALFVGVSVYQVLEWLNIVKG